MPPSPPRLLMVGAHWGAFEQMEACIERAASRLGWPSARFDYQAQSLLPSWLSGLVPASLRRALSARRLRAVEASDRTRSNRRFLDLLEGFRPDILLALRAERLDPGSVEAARERGAFAVNWLGDDPAPRVPDALVPAYDLWAVIDRGWGEWLRARGARRVEHLPLGCDPQLHRPAELSPEERRLWGSRLCFVGTRDERRERLLAAVAELGLAVWGPGWDAAKGPVRRCVRSAGRIGRAEWLKAYAGAELVLNMHAQGEQGLNLRTWEALAAGACLVCEGRADLERLLPGCAAPFDGPEDLRRVCERLLADPGRRRALAAAGRERALGRHSFDRRLETLAGWRP